MRRRGSDGMATIQTGLAESIDASSNRSRLDAVAKKLVRHRIILAEILKECVEEFSGYDVRYIEQHCIVGDVKMDEISVDQDLPDADERITGSDTEDTSDKEGTVRYDLVFDAQAPKTGELIRLIINVEIQAKIDPGYPLISRAVYYLSRLISRQKGTVFTKSDYGKIRKVYSIWICPDPNKKNTNSIAEYGFTQQKVIGQVDEPAKNYDKMKAIIISLNDEGMENRTDIIRLLSTLLSVKQPVEKRKQILEDDFNIPMTREIEEEVEEMCNLGMAVETMGIQAGKEEMLLTNIRNLMETMKWTAIQAMDALKIPKDDQKRYEQKL